MSGTEMQGLQGMMGGGAAPAPGIGQIDPSKVGPVFGESDPMGTMPGAKQAINPQMLQLMLSMRGMGGMSGGAGGQPMQMPQGMPAPQVRPAAGGLMGAMPQMPQSGFRPRGMAGRF